MTSPRGLRRLRRNAGSGARRRHCRLLPGRRAPARLRAPRPEPRDAFVRHLSSVAALLPVSERESGTWRSSLPDPRDSIRRGRSVGVLWADVGGGAGGEASWGSVPKVAVPTPPPPAAGGRKKRERGCDL